jgi:hypothetical protein
METERTPEGPGTARPPRPFVSSIRIGGPSRRSQALTWIVLGAAAAAVAAVVALAVVSGASLWFTH